MRLSVTQGAQPNTFSVTIHFDWSQSIGNPRNSHLWWGTGFWRAQSLWCWSATSMILSNVYLCFAKTNLETFLYLAIGSRTSVPDPRDGVRNRKRNSEVWWPFVLRKPCVMFHHDKRTVPFTELHDLQSTSGAQRCKQVCFQGENVEFLACLICEKHTIWRVVFSVQIHE